MSWIFDELLKNHLKIAWIILNTIFFVFTFFRKYRNGKLKKLNYKNENIETKYLNNLQKTQSLKVKKTLLELENNFVELKDKELKDRELKIRKKMEKLFLKPIIVSIDDMKRFEQKN